MQWGKQVGALMRLIGILCEFMKSLLSAIFLLLTPCVSAFAQLDTLSWGAPFRSLDITKTLYPEDDGLIYDQYLGETIAGYLLADQWRVDAHNGGFNKRLYGNPYVASTRFEKELLIAYRFAQGKLFTGQIEDTLRVHFTPSAIAGYFNGKPYYESKELLLIFRANCINGLLEGKGVLCVLVPQYGIFNNLPLSSCFFENGEMVGECKHWDLNSIQYEIYQGKVRCLENKYDYFDLVQLLETTTVTYIKGSTDWTKQTITQKDGKITTIYPPKKKGER